MGTGSNSAATTTRTFSIDIGTASADRLIVVGVGAQNGVTGATVAVNGTSLVEDVGRTNGHYVGIWSGVVTSGSGAQNVVITGVSGFVEVGAALWVLKGLGSNTVRQTSGANTGSSTTSTITTTNPDYLFVMCTGILSPTFASSTQAPTAIRTADSNGPFFIAPEWISVTSAGSFTVNPTTAGVVAHSAATYH
jgi:hypothetical protein